jgi:hypothetical protein
MVVRVWCHITTMMKDRVESTLYSHENMRNYRRVEQRKKREGEKATRLIRFDYVT